MALKQKKSVLGRKPLSERVKADKKEDETKKELPPDWEQIKGLDKAKSRIGEDRAGMTYGDIVREARLLDDELKVKTARLKELKEVGGFLLAKYDIKRVSVDGQGSTRIDGKNSWLDKQKLMEKGVDPAIIKDCYSSSTYTSLNLGTSDE